MATNNGITLTPNNGSGTSQLSVSAEVYTGRVDRTATFSASNSNLDIDSKNSVVITQLGHPIFNVNSPTIESDVTTATVQGTSNYESIRIIEGGTLWDYLSSAVINEESVSKSQLSQGYSVDGDPGASAEYSISFLFTGLPESANPQTFTGRINSSTGPEISVTKRGTSVVNQIWFSDGSSPVPVSSSLPNITVTLDESGEYSEGATDVRINTDPSGLSWTISAD